jgi:hypothetical protein
VTVSLVGANDEGSEDGTEDLGVINNLLKSSFVSRWDLSGGSSLVSPALPPALYSFSGMINASFYSVTVNSRKYYYNTNSILYINWKYQLLNDGSALFPP